MTRIVTLIFTVCMTTSIALAQDFSINSDNPARPFGANKFYKYGIAPTNLPKSGEYCTATPAATAYTNWVKDFVEDCGDNGKRVKFDQVQITVSEGIAYGMLLSAYAGDKVTFDGLWQFYNKHRNERGLMGWKINGCDGGCSGLQCNAATDAELDAAIALIVAAKQWSSGTTYAADAKALIKLIKEYEMETDGNTRMGDFPGAIRYNPSYYSPAYYREYAKVDTENAAFWNTKAVEKAEEFLLANRHAVTGFVSDWAESSGAPYSDANRPNGKRYGYDAVRNPWRMATDYIWNGPEAAKAGKDICEKIGAFMVNNESNIKLFMETDGTPVAGEAWKNGSSYMTSLAAMGTTNQASLNKLYTNTNSQGGRISGNAEQSNYFSATLRCITLFVMTGNFWCPSDIEFPRTNDEYNCGVAVDFANAPQSVAVYPSPATNVIDIETAQPMQTLQVFNAMGVKILEQSTQLQHATVDVSNWARGIYFVQVKFANGLVENSRFVKL